MANKTNINNGPYILDLSNDCKIFSLHVALNAIHGINYSDYISMILESFWENENNYNCEDYVCCLSKVEKFKDEVNNLTTFQSFVDIYLNI